MIVARNEAGRYLSETLPPLVALCDLVVLWDDGSDDDTARIAADLGCEVWRTEESYWERDESVVREALYMKVLEHDPEWVLCLDADEMLEAPAMLLPLLDGDGPYRLPLLHCWGDRDTVRVDDWWGNCWTIRLYKPPRDPSFTPRPLHIGGAPQAVMESPTVEAEARVLHFGYLRSEDIASKLDRYKRLDPKGEWGSLDVYASFNSPPMLADRHGNPVP